MVNLKTEEVEIFKKLHRSKIEVYKNNKDEIMDHLIQLVVEAEHLNFISNRDKKAPDFKKPIIRFKFNEESILQNHPHRKDKKYRKDIIKDYIIKYVTTKFTDFILKKIEGDENINLILDNLKKKYPEKKDHIKNFIVESIFRISISNTSEVAYIEVLMI